MLLVYSSKSSARFSYIADIILKDLCGFELAYTNLPDEFTSYQGPKLNYSEQVFNDEIHIQPAGLLLKKV